jgi:hypothetical protein
MIIGCSNVINVKPNYNNKYRQKYFSLNTYSKKQLHTKVRKNFMSDEEFLGIYNLYRNLNTLDDFIFIINMIKTSKVYRHYKTNIIHVYTYRIDRRCSIESYLLQPQFDPRYFDKRYVIAYLSGVIEWLFSHTIHTSSLNSITFK